MNRKPRQPLKTTRKPYKRFYTYYSNEMPTKVNHGNLWHSHLMTWPFPAKFRMKVKYTKYFCFIIKEDDIDFF